MPVNRQDALKKAEKLLRQGKLDGAIEEYVQLIEDQPSDWNSINVLGDLYLRAGDTGRAVVQFVRVADHLFTEGFLPRAAALYKKALKVEAQHDHTLSQLAKTAARQKLIADARTYLRQLEQVRRDRGNEAGVADCQARIRALDEADTDAGLLSGAPEPGPQSGASPEPAPVAEDSGRLLELARQELNEGNEMEARATLTRALMLDPSKHRDVMGLALQLVRDGRIDSGFGCVDVVTDAALLGGDWKHAVEDLQAFVREVPYIPALIKLVEVAADSGLDAPLRAAQARLADAYLEEGKGEEARVISEDLLQHDPESDSHAERLRCALALLEVEDAADIIADIRGRLSESKAAEEPETEPAVEAASVPEMVEIDLSDILLAITDAPPGPAPSTVDPYARGMEHLEAGRDDEAIADLTTAALAPQTRTIASAQLGRLYVRQGNPRAAVEWFEHAADGPATTPEEAMAILYDLADALERVGEQTRALAILVDIDADLNGYRDVRRRIEELSRSQAQSHST